MSRTPRTSLLTPAYRRLSKSAPSVKPSKTRRRASSGKTHYTHTITRRRTKLPKNKYQKRVKNDYSKKAPRKYGPREIGRNKAYRGTKTKKSKRDGSFLEPKLPKHARSESFAQRKRQNPVKHHETVQEVGTPNYWIAPSYVSDELEKMNSGDLGWFTDKPLSVKNGKYEKLKGQKVPKGGTVKSFGSPNAWKPIAFEYKENEAHFLNEKLWFESSRVDVESGLSRIIEALPAEKKRLLDDLPAPTGYQSKIMYIKKLREFIMEEVRKLHKEEKLFQKLSQKKQIHSTDDGSTVKTRMKKKLGIINESDDDGNGNDEHLTDETFLNEIQKDLDKQLNDAINEVLAMKSESEEDHKDSMNEKNKKKKDDKKSVSFAKQKVTFSDVANYQEEKSDAEMSGHYDENGKFIPNKISIKDESDKNDENMNMNINHNKKDSMALSVDLDDAVDDISDDDDDSPNTVDKKFNLLLKKKQSEVSVSRRRLFTIKSVNKLNDLIDDLEHSANESEEE